MNSIGGNLHNCRLPSFNLSYAYKKSKDNNLKVAFLVIPAISKIRYRFHNKKDCKAR